MTKQQYKANRLRRRKERRRLKKKEFMKDRDDYAKVFSFENLYRAYRKCRKGVSWKASIQKVIVRAPIVVYQIYESLRKKKFVPKIANIFRIVERGKVRECQSTGPVERIVQKCLCDNSLVDVFRRSFVYENGACMKGKGYSFQVKDLEKNLRRYIRKYGPKGHIMLFDFEGFYAAIWHSLIKGIMDKTYTDKDIVDLYGRMVDAFKTPEEKLHLRKTGEDTGRGLGLGSQISMVTALNTASPIDHYVHEILSICGYGRYNDDGYLIHPDKGYLERCKQAIKMVAEKLGLKLNEKKTRICSLAHFTWLKVRFYITETGKIIKKIPRKSIIRERRKLKRLRQRLDRGLTTMEAIWRNWVTWKAYASNFNAWHTIQDMGKLYNRLFIKDWRDRYVLQNYVA